MLGLEVAEEEGTRLRVEAEGGGEAVADGEAEEKGGAGEKTKLQERLVSVMEREHVNKVLERLGTIRGRPGMVRFRRLDDLGNKKANHGWMTAVNEAHGPVLRPQQFITCLRLRLGLAVVPYEGPAKCSECGREYNAEEMGPHALCCGRGQSVKGHNRVRDHLASLAKVSDGQTSTEQKVGSVDDAERENWRPADIRHKRLPIRRRRVGSSRCWHHVPNCSVAEGGR